MNVMQALAAVKRYQASGAAHRADTTLLTAASVLADALTPAPAVPRSLRLNRFDCPECGQGIGVDEDWCCRTCGRDAVVVVDGVPQSGAAPAG